MGLGPNAVQLLFAERFDVVLDLGQQRLFLGIEQTLQIKPHPRFETTEDLGCGIALQTNAHKLGWNLRDYLVDLESDLQALIEEQTLPSERSEPVAPSQ